MDPEPLVNLYTLSFIKPLEVDTIASLMILLALIATSALISGAEVAFFAIKAQELDELKKTEITQSKTHRTISI